MNADNEKKIIISGAGLAGSLMAVYMAQRGFAVEVFEYRSDMRKEEQSAGRSINLALSERGMNALREVGLLDDIMKIAIPMYGRCMHALDGKLTFQSYSKDGKSCIYSVSRGELNCRLMTLAERESVKIHFGYKCKGVDMKTGAATFQRKDGSVEKRENCTVIGADGAFSGVRKYLRHGYKELEIPANADGSFKLENKNALHIWPRGTFMMIALPNLDGSFTCTLFFPFEDGVDNFDSLTTPDKVSDFFQRTFPDAVPLMPNLRKDFFDNPTASLCTVRCNPWTRCGGRCILLGDAAHAVVPFFGQGMNCAMEDCSVLNACIVKNGGRDACDWEACARDYNEARIDNANAIADMALENFIEMRDSTADPTFLFHKAVAHKLGNTFPSQFLSRYERVSFTNIPYREAYKAGTVNERILHALCDPLVSNGVFDAEKIDMDEAKRLIDEAYPPNSVPKL